MDSQKRLPSRSRVGKIRVQEQVRFRANFQEGGCLDSPVLILDNRARRKYRVTQIWELVVEPLLTMDSL